MKIAISLAALAAALTVSPVLAQQTPAPTAAEAEAFLAKAEKAMFEHSLISNRADWVNSTYLNDDSDAVAAYFGAIRTSMNVDYALEAAKYATAAGLSAETKRRLDLLRTALTLPAPTTPGAAQQLNDLATRLQSTYGKGKGTLKGQPINGSDIEEQMGNNRNPEELKEMWVSWHDNVGAPMRDDYAKLVDIANAGARELGFADTGAMWRSKYDMPADDFAKELDRVWDQVKPLYESLHCHVRSKLSEQYGADKVPLDKPIPAHLLGNMWAQSWGNIYDLVAPKDADPGYDVTELLAKHNYDEIKMVKGAEAFFTSLGFAPLPETFYQRSLFLKPADRDVECHASAWDLDAKDDLRIKMCIQRTGEEFSVIHHELGHNFYQRAYKDQPVYFQESANDGFHEAIGDTIALSVTPDYLKQIGLLDKVPDESKDIGLLLKMAMDKIAFVPFGLLVDQWRWKVFNGEITPAQYNEAWWQLREKYQGVAAPVARSEADFDPGAKYHVPGNVPYTRYFLAHILQFQFHKALCDIAGNEGAVHRCSIYNSKEAGAKLNQMLEMGSSQPWQQALEVVTGKPEMDATAILDYFAPLQAYLDEQNKGQQCGW